MTNPTQVLSDEQINLTLQRVAESIDSFNIVMTHWMIVARAIESATLEALQSRQPLPEAYASWLDFSRSKVKQPMTLQELRDEVAKLQTIDRSAPELLMIHAMLLLEALQSRQPAAPVAAVPEIDALSAPAQPASGEAVALKVYKGEICYKSRADDQSFGMWCPVAWDTEHGYPDGTTFHTTPPASQEQAS